VSRPQETEHQAPRPAEEDDDWAWRRKLRSTPHTRVAYRLVIFLVGLLIVLGGLALVPLPGPGWFIVILGLIVWASEFDRARRVLHWVRQRLHTWNEWLEPKPWWVKAAVGLMTLALVVAVLYAMFWATGVPTYLPDVVEKWLSSVPGLGS
jgi:uncharacterized protein (TIGR02611 family)